MSKGRPAHESSEKSFQPTREDIQRGLKNYFRGMIHEKKEREENKKGIEVEPSNKALELMKKGKRVDIA